MKIILLGTLVSFCPFLQLSQCTHLGHLGHTWATWATHEQEHRVPSALSDHPTLCVPCSWQRLLEEVKGLEKSPVHSTDIEQAKEHLRKLEQAALAALEQNDR